MHQRQDKCFFYRQSNVNKGKYKSEETKKKPESVNFIQPIFLIQAQHDVFHHLQATLLFPGETFACTRVTWISLLPISLTFFSILHGKRQTVNPSTGKAREEEKKIIKLTYNLNPKLFHSLWFNRNVVTPKNTFLQELQGDISLLQVFNNNFQFIWADLGAKVSQEDDV